MSRDFRDATVAIGDLDGDEVPDLAVANSHNVSVLLGVGDGTLLAAVDYAAGSYPESVATSDLDGDAWLDLAVANATSDNVSVLINQSVLLGDLNCDGVVNAADIDPFVLALTSAPEFDEYCAAYPDCDHTRADCNEDGSIDGFDIDPFVELLTGG